MLDSLQKLALASALVPVTTNALASPLDSRPLADDLVMLLRLVMLLLLLLLAMLLTITLDSMALLLLPLMLLLVLLRTLVVLLVLLLMTLASMALTGALLHQHIMLSVHTTILSALATLSLATTMLFAATTTTMLLGDHGRRIPSLRNLDHNCSDVRRTSKGLRSNSPCGS